MNTTLVMVWRPSSSGPVVAVTMVAVTVDDDDDDDDDDGNDGGDDDDDADADVWGERIHSLSDSRITAVVSFIRRLQVRQVMTLNLMAD